MRPGFEVAVRYLNVMSQGPVNVPIQNIKIPVLVMYGTLDDPNVAKNSKRLAREIPGAILKIVEGAGHVPLVSKPYEVIEAIENRFK